MVEAKLETAAKRTWLLESMRATFFFTEPHLWKPRQLLQTVTGQTPTNVQQPIAMSIIQESCPLGAGQFTIGQNASRVDMVLAAVPSAPSVIAVGSKLSPEEPQFIKIGPYQENLPEFKRTLESLAPKLSNFSRIGVLPIVLCEGPRPDDIFRLLCELFPKFGLERDGIEDFIWKTNRRRQSKFVDNLMINRLATWTVIQTQKLEMVASFPAGPMFQATPTGLFAVRGELDMNTDHLRKEPLPGEPVIKLFSELLSHAERFMSSGDNQ